MKLYIPVTEEKLELLNLPDASTGSIESINATFACLSIGSHSDYIQKVKEEPDLMEKYLKEEKFSVEFEAEKGVKSHRVLMKTASEIQSLPWLIMSNQKLMTMFLWFREDTAF